ncbi:MAG: A/G-specific adenine glycosylase [Myxococcota bacterium]
MKRALLDWYRANRRDLPWRKTRDPYAVWVSEIMLQQTRVDTVIPYYQRFLKAWPTVGALAAADPEAVRAQWSGLGYYRRAALMLKAAQQISTDLDGRFPGELEGLRALPGFGAYTAGAVASIAFDRAVPAIDGNVIRVIARLQGIQGDPSAPENAARIRAHATRLAEEAPADPKQHDPGDFTQALMELGALICSPKSPRCEDCPVRRGCRAHAEGKVHLIPPPRVRPEKKRVILSGLIVRRQDQVLLEQRPPGGLFAELWVVPLWEGKLSQPELRAAAEARFAGSFSLEGWEELEPQRHVLTHREIEVTRFLAQAEGKKTPKGMRFLDPEALAQLGIPAFTAKMIRPPTASSAPRRRRARP